ncbi:MAG TPA: FAD-binding protein [Steroidobacteraceae bacterium]|nr:FAD-binding protein [Steroidobacteraceae bacterium]HNS26980.1 FAD-binding protein [Steroidobacteraceae bacterium]
MIRLETDLLVIGAGAAGIVTALSAVGRRVCLLHAAGTASEMAQGGIAAAVGPDDSPSLHAADTFSAGHSLNDARAVQFACEGAPAAVAWLESQGVRFARSDAAWSLHLEAAHSRPRVLHAGGDATGAVIMDALRDAAAAAPHIEWLPRMHALALLCDGAGAGGVTAVSAEGQQVSVHARDVVLATGGIGALYSRTTNPPVARGDGLAMALAAGARCAQLAAVQFHPTALDVEASPLPLISEAVRGAGAHLVDERGRRIMEAAHPLGDLAPRDVVAAVVHAEQVAGRRVWLDATALRGVEFAQAFPSAWRNCQEHGIDPLREPIPVTCAAHYHMGGIAVDLDGRTSVPQLWAVGEVAYTGLHGANRLASNSLLETVVFGRRLGALLARSGGRVEPGAELAPCAAVDARIGDEIRQLMWRCLGPVRSATTLTTEIARRTALREHASRAASAHELLVEAMLRAGLAALTSDGTEPQTPVHIPGDPPATPRSHRCPRGS